MRQDHDELSGVQVAETQAKRRIHSESPCGPPGGSGPCTLGPQPALRPVFLRTGSSGSTLRPPCCSLGTCVSTQGQGSRDWPVSRPRFHFLVERRGLAQLEWGESFLPRAWQAVSRGAAAVGRRLWDPPVLEDPGFPAAGSGSPVAFSCDEPIHWK
ncbi:hypothetical protein MJT46_003568 [Ovis ammon polii x Ovis aries]|nr:hypothetical protein MJT46_003568 [Ovis ammon polii x Ovis aries]